MAAEQSRPSRRNSELGSRSAIGEPNAVLGVIEPFLPADAPRVEVSASDDGAILSMVAAGLGVAVLSSFSLVGYEERVRVLQLEQPIALRLGAAVKSINAAGTSARTFLSFLCAYYGQEERL